MYQLRWRSECRPSLSVISAAFMALGRSWKRRPAKKGLGAQSQLGSFQIKPCCKKDKTSHIMPFNQLSSSIFRVAWSFKSHPTSLWHIEHKTIKEPQSEKLTFAEGVSWLTWTQKVSSSSPQNKGEKNPDIIVICLPDRTGAKHSDESRFFFLLSPQLCNSSCIHCHVPGTFQALNSSRVSIWSCLPYKTFAESPCVGSTTIWDSANGNPWDKVSQPYTPNCEHPNPTTKVWVALSLNVLLWTESLFQWTTKILPGMTNSHKYNILQDLLERLSCKFCLPQKPQQDSLSGSPPPPPPVERQPYLSVSRYQLKMLFKARFCCSAVSAAE